MANTLTSLIPDVYAGLDVVSRELTGFIPAAMRDARADRVALNQSLRSPVVPANAAADVVVGMAFPTAAYQTIGNKALTITKSREVTFSWQGEELYSLNAGGPGSTQIIQDQFSQSFRTLVNEMEVDLAVAAYKGASRAYGTAGTTPFATTLADTANVRKILDDNGAPGATRSLIIDTTAGAAVRTLSQLTKANEAGTTMTLRDGELLNIHGISLKESAQVQSPTAGTMASATSTAAVFTVGQTLIPLATAGTGVVAAGDIVTFANDTNKYVVAAVSFAGANPASGDSITLQAPGLRLAQASATRAITVIATGARNVAFTSNALILATRLPALPAQGDMAIDRMVATDPRTGLSFEVSLYAGKRMVTYAVAAAWGTLATKNEHIAILLG